MRLLLSFFYYSSHDLDETLAGFKAPLDLFADSGAYSAKTMGIDIDVDSYAAWIENEGWRFSTYVNLDVIGDAEATWVNQQRMEALGLHPVPVFHGGEPWEYLVRYCNTHPYVALGGMVASDDTAALRWCVKAFQIARATGTRLHGFGQTRPRFLRSLPWFSVDSSSWASAHMYGTVTLWDHKRARFVKVPLHDHEAAYRWAGLIRAHGGDPAECAHPRAGLVDRNAPDADHWRAVRSRIIAMNARAWMRLEDWLRDHHGSVEAPEGYETKVYLATGRWAAEIGRGLVEAEEGGPNIYLATGFVLDIEGQRAGLEEAANEAGPKVYSPTATKVTDALRNVDEATGPKVYLASSGGDDGKLADISKLMSDEGTGHHMSEEGTERT